MRQIILLIFIIIISACTSNDVKFDVKESEIQEKINIASKNSNLPIDQVKTFYAKHENRHKIEDDITNEKLFNHLKEFATIKESSKTTDQLRKEKEKNG